MIPQNLKEIVSNADNAGFFQTLALVIFLLFFVGLVFYVFSRSKKHYNEAAQAPLQDDNEPPFNLED